MNEWSLSPLPQVPSRCARGRPYLHFAQKMDPNMIIARDVMTLINKEAYQDVWRQSGIRIFATTGKTHET
jgi:hypothetical protein